MKIGELFETKVEDKIEPVIKVAETADEKKLAAEIGSYVITPLIECYLDDFLEHYTDTFLRDTTEIGVWISGYFGSGKSHLAKILALLAENRKIQGVTACERFIPRIPPDAPRLKSIDRSLKRMNQCQTEVLAFNINTLADSRTRPLPWILLSQYYVAKGYSSNLLYARVIEAELDKQGRLAPLHSAVESRTKKDWSDVQRNLSFYRTHLNAAACEVAPEVFSSPQEVERALKEAESGEIHNVAFLIDTILDDLRQREKAPKKPQRLLLVLDESGQWIENDKGRLAQLQALIEEASIKGQGKIWITVTTHGDMGSIYKEARAIEGEMKKIEGRFRFKPALTTENIELVLENRLFKKKLAGVQALDSLYASRGAVLRAVGELANTSQALPSCTQEKFATYYPFFPCQVHLIPEIVKSLRSKGGHGEQMSGSTRTLLAISQDILRSGRRRYLEEGVGALVSFDEVYHNLAGEGEISPDVRTELSRLKDVVPGATPLTPKVAEVLYLIHELAYIPRTGDNIARLLVESSDDDLPTILSRVEPELERLIKAKLVAHIGEEYEFLTGERRTFEEEVTTVEQQYRQQDKERGFSGNFLHEAGRAKWREWLGSDVVSYKGKDFSFKLEVDDAPVSGTQGQVSLRLVSPLMALGGVSLPDLENRSLMPDAQFDLFFFCGRVAGFDQDLTRFLAMKEVVGKWIGDPHKSEEARKLAQDRETKDLPKLEGKVLDGLKEGLRTGRMVFRGSSRALDLKGQMPRDALRSEMATHWPTIYPKFDRVPVRIVNDQKAIQDVMTGTTSLTSDVKELKLYDNSGKIDLHAPLLDHLRIHLATQQNAGRRVLGKQFLEVFEAPPYGWDTNAVRVGVAALVRAGSVKVVIQKKPYTNPADRELIDALRVSRNFDKVEVVLEETEIPQDMLMEVRTFLIKLTKKRGIDETPAALSEAAGEVATTALAQADVVDVWAAGSGMSLPTDYAEGEEAWGKVLALANPTHRVREVHTSRQELEGGFEAIERHSRFHKQHGVQFVELKTFVDQVAAVEHLLGDANGLRALLDDYRAAESATSFADKENWKKLQASKAQSNLELSPLLEGWRQAARDILQESLDRLPEELSRRQLEATAAEELSPPLIALRDQLDAIVLPAHVAALPQRANQAVRQVQLRIEEEASKRTPKPGPGPSPRPVRKVRFADVSTTRVVQSVPQWEEVSHQLDQRVRQVLAENNDVELE